MIRRDKIAIIGIGCLFPGAHTPAQFWQNLINGAHTTALATAAELGADPAFFYDTRADNPDASYFLRGGYIRDFAFDPQGYALPADALAGLDSLLQWSLYVAREALQDSGYTSGATLARCGAVLGSLSFPTRQSSRLFAPIYDSLLDRAIGDLLDAPAFALPALRSHANVTAARSSGYAAALIAQALGLGGPYFALDAACASSLYAVGLACDYLNAGRADLMLAGAVSAADPLFVNLGFAQMGAYPRPGAESRPLDAASDGLIAGEGAGIFVLKRYADAQRDGDRIYALVSGVGLSNDGRGKHVLTPNSKGQVLAFERAYTASDIHAQEIAYVECHASGTPLGDKTELNSMEMFFAGRGLPFIGSVKSNVGHLLTAAGMASMLKVILSLGHDRIPATVGVRHPLESQGRLFSGGQIVAQDMAWPGSGRRRAAGVNAFGFGGVSAHMVLESPGSPAAGVSGHKAALGSAEQGAEAPAQPMVPLAIVGMDAHFGPLEGLGALARAVYDGQTAFIPLPAERWEGMQFQPELLTRFGLAQGEAPPGAYIESFDLDFLYYKIPPNPADEPIPQQLLLLKVADRAIRDAGLTEGANVAVLVALGTELALHQFRGRVDLTWQIEQALNDAGVALTPEQTAELERISKDAVLTPAQVNHYASYIGNIAASRVSGLWDFSGPAFTISAEENSVFRALEVAQLMLANREVEAVVVGAVDLAGGMESVLLRNNLAPLHQGKSAAGFDREASGWLVGEGAGAVVLKRADDAASDRTYARVEAVSIAQTVAEAAPAAYAQAGLSPAGIGYLELHASGIAREDEAEISALTGLFRGASNDLTCAVGSVKANIGHTWAASGMASLIKTALCVSQRFIPAVPNWNGPELPDQWQDTPFWVATKSRTWFGDLRRAAVSGLSADGSAAHVIVSGVEKNARENGYLRGGSPYLFLLAGSDAASITGKLDGLHTAITASVRPDALAGLADETYADYAALQQRAAYTLAIVGRSAGEIVQEIERARQGVPGAIQTSGEWSTPAGSYFTARPVGREGKVAFVYPGAFNSYPKMGYDLLHLFPRTFEALKAVRSDVGEAVAERMLYPRSLEKPGPRLTNAMKNALAQDPVAMVESGLGFALLYTRVMQDYFKLKPDHAFGYSLGEGSMMWGMGVWRDGDAGSAALRRSPLFTSRLAGRMDAIREAWGIPDNVDSGAFWTAYFIAAPVEKIRAAVAAETKVYLTHINTPSEAMIAGDPAACQRVVAAVGGESMKAPFSVVIHNEAMLGEYGEFHRLHNLGVHPVQGVTFYSAADYAPVKLEQSALANAISRMACKQIDFPRLVERAYADGARVFIELGPRSTCARWIDETLEERPHVAVSIDNLGSDDRASIVKMLARLLSHRVPLDVSALYAPVHKPDHKRALIRTVRTGGQDIYAAIVNDANRTKFAAVEAAAPAAAPAASLSESRMAGAPAAAPLKPRTVHAPARPVSDPASAAHITFLQTRRDALRHLGELVEMQMETARSGTGLESAAGEVAAPVDVPPMPVLPAAPPPNPAPAPSLAGGITPMFDERKVRLFATGRVADCFGERYAIYDGIRAPRIPNGDLLLISRAVTIEGERYRSEPGTRIHAEYDVPADAWFYRDNPYPVMPYSVYMEIALQPCGFLSAYHGPTLQFPEIDFYFRNLDGQGRLVKDVDMRGRTITNHVTLLTSTIMQGIIIQKFDFRMYDGDLLFYEGDATFGYFTREALSSQAGLDLGKLVPRWMDTVEPDTLQVKIIDPRRPFGSGFLRLAHGQLGFTDEIRVIPGGGKYDRGYAYAHTVIDPNAWFFKNHFYQDPVMPGSIGVETIMQALQAYAIETGLGAGFNRPRFAQADEQSTPGGHNTIWRYRGQILSDSDKSHIEANIKRIEQHPGRVTIYADASLWRDKLRIYEVKDIALAIVEG